MYFKATHWYIYFKNCHGITFLLQFLILLFSQPVGQVLIFFHSEQSWQRGAQGMWLNSGVWFSLGVLLPTSWCALRWPSILLPLYDPFLGLNAIVVQPVLAPMFPVSVWKIRFQDPFHDQYVSSSNSNSCSSSSSNSSSSSTNSSSSSSTSTSSSSSSSRILVVLIILLVLILVEAVLVAFLSKVCKFGP